MSVLDFLFGGEPLPEVTSTQTTEQYLPEWYAQYLSQLIGRASAVAGEPYQPYTQPRIAGFSPDQTESFNMVRDSTGAWIPAYDNAIGYTEDAATPFDQGQFDQFFNPYVDSVVDRIATLGGRNLEEQLLPKISDSFTGAGHWGSTRHADFNNRALRDTQEAVLGEQGRALASGFESQMGAYQDAMGRRLDAGQQMADIGTNIQTQGLRDAAALESIGRTQQGQQQANLDLAYGDFLEQRDYPRTNVSFLSNVIRGLPMETSTQTTSTGPASQGQLAPSGLAQLTGTGLGIYGLGSSLGWFKEGGPVRGRPKGLASFAGPRSTGAAGRIAPTRKGLSAFGRAA